MGSSNDCFALLVGHFNDFLLVNRDISRLDFNAQIASGDHDAVGNFQDLIEVIETFLVFDLGDDLDLRLAHFGDDLADLQDILCPSDKRSGDEIDIVVAAETDVFVILHGDKRHGQFDARHIAAFSGSQLTVDFNSCLHFVAVVFQDGQSLLAIVDQDIITGLDIIKDFLALNGETVVCTFDVFTLNRDDLALLISLGIVLEYTQTDFRTLGIQHDTQIDSILLFYFSDCIDPGKMFFMCAMGEIQSYDIHTFLSHPQYRVIIV